MKISTLVAVAAVVAMGCGGQSPKRYQMAVDTGAFAPGTFPSTCTTATQDGTDKLTLSDNRLIWQYEIWTAADGKTTEFSTSAINLEGLVKQAAVNVSGSQNQFLPIKRGSFTGTIESADGKVFKLSSTETIAGGADTVTDATTITITFTDTTYTKGSITVTASRDCTSGFCSTGEKFTCSPGALPFVSTQVTGTNTVNF